MISSSMEPESFTAQAYGGYKPEVLRPITKGWEGIFRQAERARKPFGFTTSPSDARSTT